MSKTNLREFLDLNVKELIRLGLDEIQATAFMASTSIQFISVFKDIDKQEETNICPHCKNDIRVRNPSGYCDHLYYPNNCSICMQQKNK